MTSRKREGPAAALAAHEALGEAMHPEIAPRTPDRQRTPPIVSLGDAVAKVTAKFARTKLPEPLVIAEWPHSRSGELVRVLLAEYKSRAYVHIRRFWRDADGQPQPGKGFACHVDNLPAIEKAVTAATAKARELGLLRTDGAL